MVFILLILAFGLITVLNINTGNVHISLSEIIDILLKKATDTKEYSIIWKIRLPRILMAAILGGALSLSGFLLQTFFEIRRIKPMEIREPIKAAMIRV